MKYILTLLTTLSLLTACHPTADFNPQPDPPVNDPEFNPQPDPPVTDFYSCGEALEEPGIVAARLEGDSLDKYRALRDCICNVCIGDCRLGLVSNQMLLDCPDYEICRPLLNSCRAD